MTMHRHNQRGLSLISLMIALLIGAFLLAGLFTVWFQTRTTFKSQNQMAQLQENQRMALIILANAVQTAGYYPVMANYGANPPTPRYQQSNVFAAAGPFTVAGQAIYGTHSTTNATNDMLELRFMTDLGNANNNNTLDCLGQADTAQTMVTETFQLDTKNDLTCIVTINGQATTAQTLVPCVQVFEVLYGVSTTPHDNSVTEYLTADQVTTNAMWGSVQSANLQLTFLNPLYGQPGMPSQTLAALPMVSRIVSLKQTAQ